MQYITLLISIAMIAVSTYICIRELCINYCNPIPKFNDSERSINTITFIKTKSIL